MSFGSRLKRRREEIGLTQVQLAKTLGVTKGAVGNYESEISSPKADILYRLFDVLKCDANYLFQDEMNALQEDNATLWEMENIIKKYRNLDDHGKKIISLVMEEELQRIQDEENSRNVAVRDMAKVIYYDFPASAGTGMFLENEYPTYIEVPKDKIPAGTDFAIRVSGDSMEPNYIDGDIVFVQQTEVHKGDTGIFIIDGDGYIKELGDGILISKNKDYKDIKINENNEQHILGKVVGKL